MSSADIQCASLTIVTGADSKYFRCLYQFLKSIIRHKIHTLFQIEVYDLGLTLPQRSCLEREYGKYSQVSFQQFPFDQYPDYLRIGSSKTHMPDQKNHGNYAWKPVIIADVLERTKGCVLWLDSATVIRNQLARIIDYLNHDGVYVPFGGTGLLGAYTHPRTLDFLNVPAEFYSCRIRAAGVAGFNYNFSLMRQLVQEWRHLALVEACINPSNLSDTEQKEHDSKDCSLDNHRYEQSILTFLLYQYQHKYGIHLTDDSIDISSPVPIEFLSTRNKVENYIPLWLDFVIRAYYFSAKYLDISIHRLRSFLGNPRID